MLLKERYVFSSAAIIDLYAGAQMGSTNSARSLYEARRVRLSAVMFANVPRNAHCMRTMGTGSLRRAYVLSRSRRSN